MPRFVILEHDHPELHWDLMLEVGGSLKTWRLARPPGKPDDLIPATPLGDHRIAYLDYEGPVSGNRGSVKRWDAGIYQPLGQELLPARFEGTRVRAALTIEVAEAGWLLRQVASASAE